MCIPEKNGHTNSNFDEWIHQLVDVNFKRDQAV